jgi:Excalibur calcium-binding domain.
MFRAGWALTLLLLAHTPTAPAQAPGDTVRVEVPADRDCNQFASQQEAQGWFDAVQIITSLDDAHRLDADGDGQPCEGLRWGKVEQLGPDTSEYFVRYELTPAEFECPTVGEPFTISALKSQAVTAAQDTIPYRTSSGIWPRWECVHTISKLSQ